jgi:tetratricopeptide (TPR) repeat protein
VTEDRPLDYDATLAAAEAAYRDLRLVEAADAYRRAEALRPDAYEPLLGLARTLTRQRRHAEALAATERLLAIAPERWEGHAALGALHFLTDRYDDAAAALLRAAELAPEEPEPHLTLAQLRADTGAFDEAHRSLERARALVLASYMGAEREALEALAFHVESYILLAEGREAEATEAAQRVVGMRAANPHAATLAHSNLGILAARRRDLDGAIEYLEAAYAMNPFFYRVGGALGRILLVRQRYERAAEVLAQTLETAPEPDGATRYAYGLALARLGRRAEAQEQFRWALGEPGLKGVARAMAVVQMAWQSAWGRYALVAVGLAALAAWIWWFRPAPQSLVLVALFVGFFALQRFLRGRRKR